jgi:tripartite-type tricarboxylate transporter receptor subunit TctC
LLRFARNDRWEIQVFVTRRTLVRGALASALLPRGAHAADYPARPVRVIVPYAPGGALDTVARVLSAPLGEALGQSIVIYNRPGGGGLIGMNEAAKSPPDGYTLLLDHSGLTYMPGLHANLPFDPVKDFAGVVTAVSGSYVLAVNNDLAVHSVAELIAHAKSHPGKLSYGSAGVGTSIHLAAEFFARTAGIEIVHVPYKGAAPAVTDLAGGQIPMMFGPTTDILPQSRAGRIRALAVTSPQRSKLAPELPTVAETLAGYEVVGWYGLAAPAGTPADVVARLNAVTNKVLQAGDLIAKYNGLGFEPVGGPPEEANARIKSDVERWTKIIRDAGIKAQ